MEKCWNLELGTWESVWDEITGESADGDVSQEIGPLGASRGC